MPMEAKRTKLPWLVLAVAGAILLCALWSCDVREAARLFCPLCGETAMRHSSFGRATIVPDNNAWRQAREELLGLGCTHEWRRTWYRKENIFGATVAVGHSSSDVMAHLLRKTAPMLLTMREQRRTDEVRALLLKLAALGREGNRRAQEDVLKGITEKL